MYDYVPKENNFASTISAKFCNIPFPAPSIYIFQYSRLSVLPRFAKKSLNWDAVPFQISLKLLLNPNSNF